MEKINARDFCRIREGNKMEKERENKERGRKEE